MEKKQRKVRLTQRHVWKLWHGTGWTQRRIARHLGISESAVSQRLAGLRKRMGPRWANWHDRRVRTGRPYSLSDVDEV